MLRRVGVIELIAATASLHNRLNPAFWIELAVKRQLYSVMPQAISVWARQRGCETFYATYVGLGHPERIVPQDLDILFISTPTQHSAIAYALACIFRQKGVLVVLGGAHARAYPHDSIRFADVVVTDCDKQVIDTILAGDVPPGTIIRSARALSDLPLVEERRPEIRAASFVRGRQRATTTISLLSSLGCPYDCDFCSEWSTPYAAFDTARLTHELDTISRDYPGALIGFHDPNFGVRFDQTLAAFENRSTPRNPFVMEASLSLLGTERLRRLRDAGCVMVAPGIESWADYSKKSRTTRISGQAKYEAVSAKMREIEEILPTVQANIILGVDADAGDEPFELTRCFILDHPKVWTNVNIPIPFGFTPFAERVAREGRLVTALPFAFYTAPYLAMRPQNYSVEEYLSKLIVVYETMTSARLLARRVRVLKTGLLRGVVIARTAALRVELAELRRFARALKEQAELRRFHEGDTQELPDFYGSRLRARLGRFHDWLPAFAHQPVLAADTPIQSV